MTRLEKLISAQDKIFKVMQTESKKVFQLAFKEVFAAYPQLETISWAQYTPYFNDGEPCEFAVYDILLNDDDSWTSTSMPKKLYDELEKVIHSIPEGVMKAVYGDHAKVIVDREGITIEEYKHD